MPANQNRIQVFEHQSLKVGGGLELEHFEQLAAFAEKHNNKYFSLLHQGIKFSNYVGALQVGNLTIEILPKADKNSIANKHLWQGVLLDMLRECRLLKYESLGAANLKLQFNSILDLYFEIFVSEVEKLLQKGLIKSYRRQEGNLQVLKGRLVIPKQIRINLFHKDQFYTNHEVFDFNHPLNQIIFRALCILEKMVLDPRLSFKIKRLKSYFPKIQAIKATESLFQKITFNRKTIRYQSAIEIAHLIILHYSPDIKSGQNHLIALLFDMNLLFEEYVYRQIKKQQNEDFIVKRQQQKPFWNRRYLRPDILIEWKGENIVLDTKWKVLKKLSPKMEDLRQAFVYNQFFEAKKCILLYPQVYDLDDLKATPFENKESTCQVNFLDILKDNKLNKKLGINLLKTIIGDS